MKSVRTIMTPLVSFFLICSCTAISDRLDELENRIAALESLCAQMNDDIAAMEAIVSAQQAGDYITEVLPITEDGTVITIPKQSPLSIEFAEEDLVVMTANSSKDIRYTITGTSEQHKSTEWYEDVYSEYSSVLTFDAQ